MQNIRKTRGPVFPIFSYLIQDGTHSILYTMEYTGQHLMAWDFDFEMLFYLAMITAGFFLVPMESNPPYFFAIGAALVVSGVILVYRKVKKN